MSSNNGERMFSFTVCNMTLGFSFQAAPIGSSKKSVGGGLLVKQSVVGQAGDFLFGSA